MKGLQLLAFAAVVCLLGGAARGDDKVDYAKLIVGKWEATKADPGTVPVGTQVEFTKDGKMKLAAKRNNKEESFEGTYTVEKNTFTMKLKVGDQEKSQTITITTISDKEMSTKDKGDKVVVLKRK